MTISTMIFLAALAFAIFYIVMIYNNLVDLKHQVSQAFANIEVLLKQRHDELPKLVESCKQYMQHERETLSKVTEARAHVAKAQQANNIPELALADGELRSGLAQLFAVVENYPDLKADQSFMHLQQRITGLEHSLSDRRELYNESVNSFNVRIEQFPDVLVAKFFNYKSTTFLKFKASELEDVNVGKLFNS